MIISSERAIRSSQYYWNFFKEIKKNPFSIFIHVLHTNNAMEFMTNDVSIFCANNEIILQTFYSHTFQQNGVAKRNYRHILNVTCTIIHACFHIFMKIIDILNVTCTDDLYITWLMGYLQSCVAKLFSHVSFLTKYCFLFTSCIYLYMLFRICHMCWTSCFPSQLNVCLRVTHVLRKAIGATILHL